MSSFFQAIPSVSLTPDQLKQITKLFSEREQEPHWSVRSANGDCGCIHLSAGVHSWRIDRQGRVQGPEP